MKNKKTPTAKPQKRKPKSSSPRRRRKKFKWNAKLLRTLLRVSIAMLILAVLGAALWGMKTNVQYGLSPSHIHGRISNIICYTDGSWRAEVRSSSNSIYIVEGQMELGQRWPKRTDTLSASKVPDKSWWPRVVYKKE